MKVAVLTAILGGQFDEPVDPVFQNVPEDIEVVFHRFTDENFPPITGLTPRLQYRIPKLFGWDMFPGHDVYIWLDGAVALLRGDCVKWYVEQLGDNDMVLFRHPWRGNIKDESDHIEKKLQEGNKYLVPRYLNGLHKEQLAEIQKDPEYKDDVLYASTAFVYRDTPKVRAMLKDWWYYQSRYYTCDQLALPYVVKKHDLKIKTIKDSLFKIGYLSLISHH